MRDAGGGHHGEEIKEWFTSVEFSYVALVLEGKIVNSQSRKNGPRLLVWEVDEG